MMKILVADQDPLVCTLVATRLKARGYEVMEATRSLDVLRAIEVQKFDLIILATNLDRIEGKLPIDKIRQKAHLMAVPIILMTEQDKISELIMSQERGFDDFLMKPFNPLVLQLRVAMNIARATQRMEANALTRLPGNPSIDRMIRAKIESGEKFSVLYIDINNFKSFNDRYSFEQGDDVIRQTAKILIQTRDRVSQNNECFIGHIGGDDFIVVLTPAAEEIFARTFINEFDRIIPTYYHEQDRKRGFIRVTNRQGKKQDFPLMSCAVAACNNLHKIYKSLGEIARDAAEVKGFLKSQPGSHYLRDRRSSPVHGTQEAMEILAPEMEELPVTGQVDPLGQILLGAGLISYDQLQDALKRHLETGQRLGQILIAMNAVKSEDVGKMLEKKLSVPYISLKQYTPKREMLRLFTTEFVRSHRVVPLEISGEEIRLGMCDPFDLKTLDAIERITSLKPVPCLALEDEFEEFLDQVEAEAVRE
ncbi:MAG: response regulator [Candidatus Omnitrophica bacterium]|nr:response regulator [Candidatus Omnitrophota bacterium]